MNIQTNCYTLRLTPDGAPQLLRGIRFATRPGPETERFEVLDFGMLNQADVLVAPDVGRKGDLVVAARIAFKPVPARRRQEMVAMIAPHFPAESPPELNGLCDLQPTLLAPREEEALPAIVHVPQARGIAWRAFPENRFVHANFRSDSPQHPMPGFRECGQILAAIAPGPPLGVPCLQVLLEGSDWPVAALALSSRWIDGRRSPTVAACFCSQLDELRADANKAMESSLFPACAQVEAEA